MQPRTGRAGPTTMTDLLTEPIGPPGKACDLHHRPAPEPAPVPTKSELQQVIPAHCFERRLSTSLGYAMFSVALTVLPGLAAWRFLPMSLTWLPVWLTYAMVAGTAACGVWVVAHECGHDAFCGNKRLQDGIGFVLHSALLVPYFSWQRSHAIHHAKTNHLTDGETHVPRRVDARSGQRALTGRKSLGTGAHTVWAVAARLLFGWPAYLLVGATGGPARGMTNHFWPYAPFSAALFPARWARRVLTSAVGVLTVVCLLLTWAVSVGSIMPVVALYIGPYLVCNAWLVAYTWMHHTGADTPHYDDPQWSFVRGAFCSIDRPYGRVLDLVHHHIGSTHVAHHLFARIPHYHAVEATEALRAAYPELYRYDPTPIPKALWRVGRCIAVTPTNDGWRYTDF